MSNVLGIWHVVLKGGQDNVFRTPAVVQITNVSFGEEIVDLESRSAVKLSFAALAPEDNDEEDEDDEEPGLKEATTVLCALTPGKIEHATLNITLGSDEDFKLENNGKNTVYLTGHYLDNGSLDTDSDSDDEDAYDLREVSSDVEMLPDDLDDLQSDGDRFEEVDEDKKPPKAIKRPRESEGADAKADKADKKKKLKAEDGKAVPVEVPAAGDKPQEKEKKKKKEKKKAEDGSKKDQKVDPAKKTITGGVVIEDHKIGKGPMAKKGDTVGMRYIGKLTSGKEFDKNTGGKPFTFHLGKGEVIKGWDEGIVGMQAGGERILTIPPNMAYGKEAKPGIPRNSTLTFEVKLLEIK